MSRLSLFVHELARSAENGAAATPFIISEFCATDRLPDARNETVRGFLDHSPCDWLLVVDSDMGFPPDTAERLIAAADPVERPIMGALCFAQKPNYADPLTGARRFSLYPTLFTWHDLPDKVGVLAMHDYPRDQVVKVAATGAACFVVHRVVLESMRDKYGDQWFSKIKHPTPPPHGTEFSEDLSFFIRAQACDFPVHVHTGVKTSHDKGGVHLTEDLYRTSRMMYGERFKPNPDAKVSVLLPTRKRPEKLAKSIASLRDNATGDIEILVAVDPDDSCDADADRVLTTSERYGYGRLQRYYDELSFAASGEWLLVWNDDAVMETPGWDRVIAAQPRDRVLKPASNHAENLNPFPVVPAWMPSAAGHFSLSPHNDTWWEEVSRSLRGDIGTPIDVSVRHERADLTGEEPDEVYLERVLEGSTFYANPVYQAGIIEDAAAIHREMAP